MQRVSTTTSLSPAASGSTTKQGVGGGGAIDLVMHIAGVDFSVACRSLADEFRPLAASQANLSFPSSSGCQTAPEKKSFEDLIAPYAVRDDSNWPVARAYLNETRKIDAAIVDRHRGADD